MSNIIQIHQARDKVIDHWTKDRAYVVNCTSAIVRSVMLKTGGEITICSSNYIIKHKSLGCGAYKMWLEVAE